MLIVHNFLAKLFSFFAIERFWMGISYPFKVTVTCFFIACMDASRPEREPLLLLKLL
jgi:hypothetical protein